MCTWQACAAAAAWQGVDFLDHYCSFATLLEGHMMLNLARIGARSSARVGNSFLNAPSCKGFATVAESSIKITFVDGEVSGRILLLKCCCFGILNCLKMLFIFRATVPRFRPESARLCWKSPSCTRWTWRALATPAEATTKYKEPKSGSSRPSVRDLCASTAMCRSLLLSTTCCLELPRTKLKA